MRTSLTISCDLFKLTFFMRNIILENLCSIIWNGTTESNIEKRILLRNNIVHS